MKEVNEKKGEKRKELLFIFVFFLFSIGCIVFAVLCLSDWHNPFIQRNFILFSILCGIIILTLYGFSVWFTLANKEAWLKAILSLYILLLFCLILIFIFQKTGFFEVFQNAEKLQAYLEKAGVWMPFLYIVLQFLQVIILPIPSIVSTAAGVTLFGAFRTMIYSLIGILLGSFVAFFIGRKLGHRAVSWMIGEENLIKWQKKLKGKDNLFLTIMFVLPLFPDDILCFVAGLSSMSTRYFVWMIIISRLLGIAGTCYSIDFIPFNTWWGIMLWCLFLALIVTAFILVYKNMDKIQRILKKITRSHKRKKEK